MKQLFKRMNSVAILIGIVASVVMWPGAVQPVAAQDAGGNTIYVPFITSGNAIQSSVTDEQNYVVSEADVAEIDAAAGHDELRPLRPSRMPSFDVAVTNGIVYGEALVVSTTGEVSTVELLLDLYEPVDAPEKLRPTMIMVHGGAFIRGSRLDPNLARAAHEYASRGYAVVSIGYRLGGGPNLTITGELGPFPILSERVGPYADLVNSVESIRFLDFLGDPVAIAAADPLVRLGQAAAMDDTLTAFDWIEENAHELMLDLNRLVMFGGSAGAITSLHAAYALDDLGIDAPRIAAVLDHWGAFNLDDDDNKADGPTFMERNEAAIFIIHGTNDVEVPFTFGKLIWQRAQRDIVNVPSRFVRVAGGTHGFASINIFAPITKEEDTLLQRTVNFLDDVLYYRPRVRN